MAINQALLQALMQGSGQSQMGYLSNMAPQIAQNGNSNPTNIQPSPMQQQPQQNPSSQLTGLMQAGNTGADLYSKLFGAGAPAQGGQQAATQLANAVGGQTANLAASGPLNGAGYLPTSQAAADSSFLGNSAPALGGNAGYFGSVFGSGAGGAAGAAGDAASSGGFLSGLSSALPSWASIAAMFA